MNDKYAFHWISKKVLDVSLCNSSSSFLVICILYPGNSLGVESYVISSWQFYVYMLLIAYVI